MKIQITKLPKSEIELKIEVSPAEWQKFYDEAAKELGQKIKIEGFRPGRAPAKLVAEKVGEAKILEEAAERCVKKSYLQAVTENNIEAIGRPEINITKIAKDNPFEFKAKVAILPEITLPDYKQISRKMQQEKKEVSVSDEELEKSIDWLRKSRVKYITVNRPAKEGDRVEINFEGRLEGEVLKELSSQAHPTILGKGYLMSGFEEKLYGMSEGEEKSFDLTFPEDFAQKHLAGKSVNFKVKMNLVQEAELPEINDAFAQGLGNFINLAALKQSIKEGLLLEKQNQEKNRWRSELIKKIAQETKMEIPEILIDSEIHRMIDEAKVKVAEIGLDFSQFLEQLKKTESDLHKEYEPQAIERVKSFLILQEIAKRENIIISEEEITEEANKALRHFKDAEEAQENIDINQLRVYTENILKNEKVFALLESC